MTLYKSKTDDRIVELVGREQSVVTVRNIETGRTSRMTPLRFRQRWDVLK